MEPPSLDQVSSQALIRLAAERGRTPAVEPAGEEAVRKPGKGWKRWLPILFFALGIFALVSMGLGVTALADDGWSWSDGVQLLLMVILVFGTVSQARSMLRPTRVGRWFSRRRSTLQAEESGSAPRSAGYTLDAVSAEYLTALRPAEARTMSAATVARRAGSRAFDRVSVWVVLVLAVLAFLGMLFVLAWIIYAAGYADPSLWLTAPFTALTGLGVFQLFKSASQMSFRGRPWALLTRTFRDSVRVYGSGSMATKVAVTTTATASIAGSAVIPALAPQDTLYDIFAIDAPTAAVYRIDLQTHVSTRATDRQIESLRTVALGTTPSAVSLADGNTLPRNSLLVLFESPAERFQVVIGFRPTGGNPIQVTRIQPPLPNADFTGGPGALHAVQPDGALWRVDLATGNATRLGSVTVPLGPFAFHEQSKTLVMVSGNDVVRLNPTTGAEVARTPLSTLVTGQVCSIAAGPADTLFFGISGSPEIIAVKTSSQKVARIVPTGEVTANPCELTVALRR